MLIFKIKALGAAFTLILVTYFISVTASAKERITNFDVFIKVEQDGDIIVTETIGVIKEGVQINKGIFRDLPRRYKTKDGNLPYKYNNISVLRNGSTEKYTLFNTGDAFRIRIGDADKTLADGPHTYVIDYTVKNQVRYFNNYDEVYWNVTGSYWAFPIENASVQIQFPKGSIFRQQSGYTGAQGSTTQNYSFDNNSDIYTFNTIRALAPYEGFTAAIGIEKGLIDPPSKSDRGAIWWIKNGALLLLSLSFLGILRYYYKAWDKVGRDPVKGPVIARYAPPKGYSAAAAHRVYYKDLKRNKALTATLLGLSIKNRITLDIDKKKTIIKRILPAPTQPELMLEEEILLGAMFKKKHKTITLRGKPHAHFSRARDKFHSKLTRNYSSDYHKYNAIYTLGGVALSIIAIIVASTQISGILPVTALWVLLALIFTNIIFAFLMPAPTRKGQDIKTELEGFKLYLETAEKLQMNTAMPDADKPPAMSIKRYEAFLPYAIALNVEEPWTKYFETVLPIEAQNYNPTYAHISTSNSLSHFNDALVSNISSNASSSMPPVSSSSSGSSGGGFSGGGGGGGGGGGW